jgi:hypothetical protein
VSGAAIWHRLNPELSDYRAEWGARVNGQTLLEMASGTVVIVGQMTCASRADAERHAAGCHLSDNDRRVTAATFESWLSREVTKAAGENKES